MPNRVFTCNFGAADTGLSTVGYQLKNNDGAVVKARTTAGVSEFTGTGIYGANVQLSDGFSGTIEWDTGEETPIYAVEDISLPQYSEPTTGDVRSMLRAHLSQLVDYMNKKFKDIVIPPVDFKPLADELIKLRGEIADNNKEEESEPEEVDLTPVLDAVEKMRVEIADREVAIHRLVNNLEIPNHDKKLEEMSQQMTEVQKDVAVLSGDASNLIKSVKDDIKNVIENVTKEVSGVPSKISIPNYEERLKSIEKKFGDGVNFILQAGEREFKDTRKGLDDATAELKSVVKDLEKSVGSGADAISSHFTSKLSDSVRNLIEMMNELHPDTLEQRRLAKEQSQNQMKFIMGVKK